MESPERTRIYSVGQGSDILTFAPSIGITTIQGSIFHDSFERWVVNGEYVKRNTCGTHFFTNGHKLYQMGEVADYILQECGIELKTEYKLSTLC